MLTLKKLPLIPFLKRLELWYTPLTNIHVVHLHVLCEQMPLTFEVCKQLKLRGLLFKPFLLLFVGRQIIVSSLPLGLPLFLNEEVEFKIPNLPTCTHSRNASSP